MLKKIQDGLYKFMSYWNKPPKGYDVSYKEFVNFALGSGALSFMGVLIQWTAISTSTYMMISYFKLSTGVAFFLGTFLGSIFGLLRAPILSMIIDNSNDKKKRGKFKPFLLWSSIGTCVCFGLIPFIPNAWNSINLFSVTIPAIPIMGIFKPSEAKFTLAVIILFIMVQFGTFFNTLLNQAMAGIEQTISTVAQERANIGSLRGLIGNIPSSIVNIILPILAGILFADTGHQLNINLYRIAFPFCMVGGIVFILFAVKGTKERVVVNQKYKAKVSFFEGAKEISTNKYFWIVTIFNVLAGIRGFANITGWICQFSFKSSNAKTIANLFCTTLLMNALVVGMLTGPFLIKRFGKRNVLLVANIGFTVMLVVQLIFYKNPYLVLFSSFLQNIFGGFYFIPGIMTSDALDYQQWKTGKRLEGFWQNYSGFIGAIFGILTGMLMPLFLSFAGIGFGDDINKALLNPTLRDNAYRYLTLLGLIGSIIVTIPIFFYDLTEKKHANYVRVLKIRAAVDNYKLNELQDKDVLNAKEIIDYANESKDKFLLDELNKYDCLDTILADYDNVYANDKAKERQGNIEDFQREIELEEKRVLSRLAKREKKANKKGLDFDKEKTLKELKLDCRQLKYFVDGDLAKYHTTEEINNNIEIVYTELEKIWNQETVTVK